MTARKARPKRAKRSTKLVRRDAAPLLDHAAPRADAPLLAVRIDPLLGDLPAVTLPDTQAVFRHFERIDPSLALAWQRDVVVHEGPITLRRVMQSAYGSRATHYAYVDRRLLIGARWDGYLAARVDAPPGTTAVAVGQDLIVKRIIDPTTTLHEGR